jgi:predicted enzyme related to lactoylglutathione lyase
MNDVQYFEIQAEEPEEAVQFYAAVFGWKFSQESQYAY